MPRVKVGVTLKMYDYRTYRPKSVSEIADQARRAEAVGFDSVWLMDHVFIQRGKRRVMAHDPMVCAASALGATARVRVGTLVLCHAFRHVAQLAREAAAVTDVGGGRFVLGLGAGWHRPEFDALGLPYDHRVARLEEAIDPLQRMLAGEPVSFSGRWTSLAEATVARTSPAAPVWIAAEGERMLALAARASGWNHAYWGAEDTTRFRKALAALRQELARLGRDRGEVESSASIACVPGGWTEVPDGFREPEVAAGSAAAIAALIGEYAEAGADNVILSLSPDPYGELDDRSLEKASAILEAI